MKIFVSCLEFGYRALQNIIFIIIITAVLYSTHSSFLTKEHVNHSYTVTN